MSRRAPSKLSLILPIAGFGALTGLFLFLAFYFWDNTPKGPPTKTQTFFGFNREIGEPFGIAVREDGAIFVADGENGKILRIAPGGQDSAIVTDQLDTPSAIAFDPEGDLIVADSGAHVIRRVKTETGEVETIAGTVGKKGFADGPAPDAQFNAPVGIAVSKTGRVYVADTYNDKIRVIENELVSTLAGSIEGFADGIGDQAKFDTPCGLALTAQGSLVVADTGNFRLRIIEENGLTRTLAGNNRVATVDGLLNEASFVRPLALAFGDGGLLYVADGNSIRLIGGRVLPFVETLTGTTQGLADGPLAVSRFGRPSGLAADANGDLFVADADNGVVRVMTPTETGKEITEPEIASLRYTPEEFRLLGEPRWPFNPPENSREIAGTLGEIRGEIIDEKSEAWFHNGLDITGGYGERARFIRREKVLDPFAVQNFSTSRELLRMPTIGYIHIRLGRNVNSGVFDDRRFQFTVDDEGDLLGLRIPRGTRFEAGEPLGTLNPMNHVHLVAGRRGSEMNALDALVLPNISDSRPPTIEEVALFDKSWREIKTVGDNKRLRPTGKTRIVVHAFDQMDGNADRRRLGLYRIGYQLFTENDPHADINWTISFERMPSNEAVKFVYADGSRSGATGQTVFNYIASNEVRGDVFRENFLDLTGLEKGEYTLRVYAADFFGNQTSEDVLIEIGQGEKVKR